MLDAINRSTARRGRLLPEATCRLSAFALEMEITMTGALHDGLRALQLETGIESLHHSKIPVAMEQITELGKAELFVEFGVLAAHNVEIEFLCRLADRLNNKTATARPDAGDLFHRRQVCPKSLRPSLAVFSSKLKDDGKMR